MDFIPFLFRFRNFFFKFVEERTICFFKVHKTLPFNCQVWGCARLIRSKFPSFFRSMRSKRLHFLSNRSQPFLDLRTQGGKLLSAINLIGHLNRPHIQRAPNMPGRSLHHLYSTPNRLLPSKDYPHDSRQTPDFQ